MQGAQSWYSQQLAILLLSNRPCLMSDLTSRSHTVSDHTLWDAGDAIYMERAIKENVGAWFTAKDAVKIPTEFIYLTEFHYTF
jgi:hypothetical protein